MAPNKDQWETVMLRRYECFPTLSRTPRQRGQQVTSLTRVHSPIKVPVVKGLGTTYLFYVRHILRRKISASLVEDAVQPAVFYFRVVHDLNHVSLLEIQEGGVLCHVIVQGTYVLRFLWWRDKRGTLPKKSGSYSPTKRPCLLTLQAPRVTQGKFLLATCGQLYGGNLGEIARGSPVKVKVCQSINSPGAIYTFRLGQVRRIKIKIFGV